MSEFSGPPPTKTDQQLIRAAHESKRVNRDGDQTDPNARQQSGKESTGKEMREQSSPVRDPAVSISATAAHLQVGEEISHAIHRIDPEGRPIIETATMTIAMRPDAGLQKGDTATLFVTKAGDIIEAQLRARNGEAVRPPVTVQLTITGLHITENPAANAVIQNNPIASDSSMISGGMTSAVTYGKPPARQPVRHMDDKHKTSTQDENKSFFGQTAYAKLSSKGAAFEAIAQHTKDSENRPAASHKQSETPHSLADRTSVSQQSDRSHLSDLPLKSAASGHDPQKADTAQLFDANLRDLFNRVEGVKSYLPDGRVATLRPIDPSVTLLPPKSLAVVEKIQPIPLDSVRQLPLPLSAFKEAHEGLAQVTTSHGAFIAASRSAEGLLGETIHIAYETQDHKAGAEEAAGNKIHTHTPSIPQASQNEKQGETLTFTNARLLPRDAHPYPISIAIPPAGYSAPPVRSAETLTVTDVHTVRTFLSPLGPQKELRLETAKGDVAVTLANHIPIHSGDQIFVADTRPATIQAPITPTHFDQTVFLPDMSLPVAAPVSIWPLMDHSEIKNSPLFPEIQTRIQSLSMGQGSRLAPALLFLNATAGNGQVTDWLGETLMEKAKEVDRHLFELLQKDMARLASTRTSTAGEDWQVYMLPVDVRDDHTGIATILVRHDEQHRENQDGEKSYAEEPLKSTRFLIQVSLERLGRLQLDGRILSRQFDLTLRSDEPLPGKLSGELETLFATAVEANGFDGRLLIAGEPPVPLPA